METTFTFVGHTFEPEKGQASFAYELKTSEKTYNFTEKLHFQPTSIQATNYPLLTTILDNLLLILGISYWKTYCPKEIKINDFSLTHEQADFWNTVYTKGLGEFFYKNKIDYRRLIQFPFSDSVNLNKGGESQKAETGSPIKSGMTRKKENNLTIEQFSNLHRSLVFFGGGKDSIVTAELLKQQNIPFDLFLVDGVDLQEKSAQLVGAKTIALRRTIDPQLFELNKQQSVYNGHIPISAVWAFLSVFAAVVYGYNNLITSNEASSNYGNVEYLGKEINHQWSKSLEFEKLFSKYVHTYISKDLTYFSLLRPLYEIRIAELFSKYPQYFGSFSSCNRNFRILNTKYEIRNTNLWCGQCPKCLFVFILLSAFLKKTTVLEIFGKNLLDDYALVPLLRELLNIENFKPFECVGTPEETKLTLFLVSQKKDFQNDVLISLFLQSFSTDQEEIEKLQEKIFQAKLPACLPHEFTTIIESI